MVRVSWYPTIGEPKTTRLRVVERGLVGRLHDTDRPGRGLQPAVFEALHLEVEALSEPGLSADQVGRGHEPVLEGHLVGVHTAVSEGVDGTTFDPPGRSGREATGTRLLVEDESVPVRLGLLDEEQ